MIFDISTILVNNANATVTNNTATSTQEDEQEKEQEIVTKGCAEGLGYHTNDSNPRCYPLDSIGEGPPEGTAYCAALGCPYNPPDL